MSYFFLQRAFSQRCREVLYSPRPGTKEEARARAEPRAPSSPWHSGPQCEPQLASWVLSHYHLHRWEGILVCCPGCKCPHFIVPPQPSPQEPPWVFLFLPLASSFGLWDVRHSSALVPVLIFFSSPLECSDRLLPSEIPRPSTEEPYSASASSQLCTSAFMLA